MKPNMKELSKFVKWSVFGDGSVSKSNSARDAHYAISRHPRHRDYIDIIAEKLSTLPDCSINISQSTRKDNGKEVVSLRTTIHPLFSRIRDRQYIKGHRVVDPHMLTVLDWECMAFLYMDDGSLCYNNKGSQIVRLSTCAYSYAEHELLRKTFLEKLGLCFNINKTHSGTLYQLLLRRKDHDMFFDNIRRYIVPSYIYKFPGVLQEEAPVKAG